MAKSKYDPETFPLLAEGYAREGMIEKDIAKKLGISVQSLEVYKSNFPEFLESLKRGKAPVDFQVENNMLKRANGYSYDEVKKVYSNGIETERTVTTKHVVPDMTACIFWLKNRNPSKWRDKPIENNDGEEVKSVDYDNMSTEELVKRAEAIKTIAEGKG